LTYAIQNYAFINGQAILAEAGLSYWNKSDAIKIKELYNGIKAGALAKAQAKLWTAA